MDKAIARMKGHYIVCGYGRMGQEIVEEFLRHGQSVVVIEGHPEQIEVLTEREIHHVEGDATSDRCLLDAGIETARALVAVTNTDESNVFITLSGRELNPNLTIIARCDSPEAESKLARAGADRVISPYAIGARRMAHALLRPVLTDFLETVDMQETMIHNGTPTLQMGDVCVEQGAHLENAALGEARIEDLTGAVVLAIRGQEGHFRVGPSSEARLAAGDVLIALGTPEQLERLSGLAARSA